MGESKVEVGSSCHQSRQVPSPPRASWLAANLAIAPIALFAELLLRKTHHRPLAAATFAVVALMIWLLSELLARRALNPEASPRRRRLRSVAWWAGIAATVAVVARALFFTS